MRAVTLSALAVVAAVASPARADVSLVRAGNTVDTYPTIQQCAAAAVPGDTCQVHAGTYEECVSVETSGTAEQPVAFAADDGVVVRGFEVSAQFVRIEGFEITHVDADFPGAGIRLHGAHGSQILGNFIHHVYGLGIWLHHGSPSNNVVIRGNTISYAGVVPGTLGDGDGGIIVYGNSNLVENNDISHVGDFTNGWGDFNVLRNNNFHDVADADFPDHPTGYDGHHVDGFQYYSAAILLRRTLFEGNRMWGMPDMPHSHGAILRNTSNDASEHFIYRRNVVADLGGEGPGGTEYDGVFIYQNTLSNAGLAQDPKPWTTIAFQNGANDVVIVNNIFHDSCRDGGYVYSVEGDNTRHDCNLAYNVGYDGPWGAPFVDQAHPLFNVDPSFVDAEARDLRLTDRSPAVDVGGALTRVAAPDTGSGTALVVEDARFFQDGWAGTTPDGIAVGTTSNAAQIVSIDYATNTMTLAAPVTRTDGDAVWLYSDSAGRQVLYGSAPDIGAHELGELTGDTFTLTVTFPGGRGRVRSTPLGVDCTDDCSTTFAAGVEVTLEPLCTDDCRFERWSGDCAGSGDCILLMDSNKTVAAFFLDPQDGGADPGGDGASGQGCGCTLRERGSSALLWVWAVLAGWAWRRSRSLSRIPLQG